jgi:hypothetical protein
MNAHRGYVRVSAWPPSVVEDVPADRASAPLVVEDKLTHFDRDLIPLDRGRKTCSLPAGSFVR